MGQEAATLDDKISLEIDMQDASAVSEALLRQAKEIGMGLVVFFAHDSKRANTEGLINRLQHMNLVKKFKIELDYTQHTAKVEFVGKIVLKLPKDKRPKKIGKKKK